ncbi:dipeptide epimerase [Zavarzinia compransoris]|uniref:N-acetyl-D-Glu racemase DgcA n=1 Tax=Zavarzinia marina TaxID=2911065 RepID=UPI001F2006AC|nr:N-acetyl-D-Glu racemase DgcA [Zavarzinia marina]MCF4166453.1 dipeptide epimerase [Zavarzinia marina]
MELTVAIERWPIAGTFRIARGAKTEAAVVTARLSDGTHVGRGECVPYARYGETVEGVAASLRALAPAVAAGLDRAALQDRLPPGAARNALDCAFWDFAAKTSGRSAAELAGLPAPGPVTTAYTLSLEAPAAMAAAAVAARKPLLKLKLGGDGLDLERVAAVHGACPDSRLIVDANEAWTPALLLDQGPAMAGLGVALIEQPLPAAADAALAGIDSPVPLCADESCHSSADLPRLARLYSHVSVKLDKTGGLTEAIALTRAARDLGLGVMVGCMVGTSLAMAPALLLAGAADFVDLDGPLLLARDRVPGLRYEGAVIRPAEGDLWG